MSFVSWTLFWETRRVLGQSTAARTAATSFGTTSTCLSLRQHSTILTAKSEPVLSVLEASLQLLRRVQPLDRGKQALHSLVWQMG